MGGPKAISSLGWAHRDVKPENLCIDARGNVRLVDFGLSKFCEGGRCRTARGTVAFAAPEVCDVALGIEKDYDGHAADLWSLGCVLLELKTGRLAWDAGRRVSPGGTRSRRFIKHVARRAAGARAAAEQLLIADPGLRRAVTLSCDLEPPFVPRRADAPAAVVRGVRGLVRVAGVRRRVVRRPAAAPAARLRLHLAARPVRAPRRG